MGWNHRVMKRVFIEQATGEEIEWYGIHEVYYDNGKVSGFTEDATRVSAEGLDELRQTLEWMLAALDKPTLDYDEDA